MKNLVFLLLTFLLLVLQTGVTAQTYQNALRPDQRWRLSHPDCELRGGVEARLMGDTLVDDSLRYQRLLFSECGQVGEWAWVRSDATNGRLWVREPGEAEENLLMDLDLLVGDTFDFSFLGVDLGAFPNVGPRRPVLAVRESQGRKIIDFGASLPGCSVDVLFLDSLQFIEGVGPTLGFGPALTRFGESILHLACTRVSNSVDYQTEAHKSFGACRDSCLIDTPVATQEPPRTPVRLAPNPAGEWLLVEHPVEWTHYELLDRQGRRLGGGSLDGDFSQVDLGGLSSGLYWIRLLERGQYRGVAKFVKD